MISAYNNIQLIVKTSTRNVIIYRIPYKYSTVVFIGNGLPISINLEPYVSKMKGSLTL